MSSVPPGTAAPNQATATDPSWPKGRLAPADDVRQPSLRSYGFPTISMARMSSFGISLVQRWHDGYCLVGILDFSSSNQFWTRIISVAGDGFL